MEADIRFRDTSLFPVHDPCVSQSEERISNDKGGGKEEEITKNMFTCFLILWKIVKVKDFVEKMEEDKKLLEEEFKALLFE